jgi:hypothetical protein
MKRLIFLLSFLIIGSLAVFGYDNDRHKIIAGIAQQYLIDTHTIDSYNTIDKQLVFSLIDVATWADDTKYDGSYPGVDEKTADKWHYTDLDVKQNVANLSDYNLYIKANVKAKDTLYYQLPVLVSMLSNPKSSQQQRYLAFKYIVHFVGDASMPLHCSERDNDAGGNGKILDFTNPSKKGEKLHHLWDGMPATFQYTKDGETVTTKPSEVFDISNHQTEIIANLYALCLTDKVMNTADSILVNEKKSFAAYNDISLWLSSVMFDSYSFAKTNIYTDSFLLTLNPTTRHYELNQSKYLSENEDQARKQVEKAGIRLALLLNYIFMIDK